MIEGFSFACPQRPRQDNAFQRFLDAAPEDIYNPWPELAGLHSYEQARSQPLFRVTYLPTAQLDQYHSTLDKRIEGLHETFHLHSDTPAKILARILLIPTYSNLSAIMEAEDWNREQQTSWETLLKLNGQLYEPFDLISLSEELLVTALSFDLAQHQLKIDPASLMPVEQWHIAYYSQLFRTFDSQITIENLYYNTFKKLARWMSEEAKPPLLAGLVANFLQGISAGSKGGLEGVDTKDRCKLLHENIQNIKDNNQLVLTCINQRSYV